MGINCQFHRPILLTDTIQRAACRWVAFFHFFGMPFALTNRLRSDIFSISQDHTVACAVTSTTLARLALGGGAVRHALGPGRPGGPVGANTAAATRRAGTQFTVIHKG